MEIMSKLRIVHMSDLHFKNEGSEDQRIVIDALKADISSGIFSDGKSADLLVFSGDLVQAGKSETIFAAPYNNLIYPVLASLGLKDDRFFICPGNHDIDREVVRQQAYVETGLKSTLISRDSINAFVDQFIGTDLSKDQLPEPFARMKPFYKGVWKSKTDSGAIITPFSAIQTLEINGLRVAVCSFNSAWRCTGEADGVDRGNLIIGERVIDHAVQNTKDSAIRIALFHHPFDWLTDADRTAVEARLHSEFSAFFFGHVHSSAPTYTRGPLGGAVYSQAGCLYQTRSYFNGYSVVELDLENQQVSIQAREYSDRIRSFTPAIAAIPGGEVRFDYPFLRGGSGDNLMALLATVRPAIKRLGDEHVRLADESGGVVLDKHFIPPPLTKPRRVSDYDKPEGDEDDKSEEYSISDFGKRVKLRSVGQARGGQDYADPLHGA